MSMLSAQCDELREVAYKVDEYQMGRERVPLKTAAIMREAADTIWQLRDDLQRANAENARLRSELEAVGIAAYLYGRDDLKAENAKLRDAVATAIKVQTVLCGDADSLYCRNECPLHRPESNDCLACDVMVVAQELEIEVD